MKKKNQMHTKIKLCGCQRLWNTGQRETRCIILWWAGTITFLKRRVGGISANLIVWTQKTRGNWIYDGQPNPAKILRHYSHSESLHSLPWLLRRWGRKVVFSFLFHFLIKKNPKLLLLKEPMSSWTKKILHCLLSLAKPSILFPVMTLIRSTGLHPRRRE